MIKVYHNTNFIDYDFRRVKPTTSALTLVAEVDTDDLDHAWALTNSAEIFWWLNPGVTRKFSGRGTRSTSVGDVLQTADSRVHIVAFHGFDLWPEGAAILARVDAMDKVDPNWRDHLPPSITSARRAEDAIYAAAEADAPLPWVAVCDLCGWHGSGTSAEVNCPACGAENISERDPFDLDPDDDGLEPPDPDGVRRDQLKSFDDDGGFDDEPDGIEPDTFLPEFYDRDEQDDYKEAEFYADAPC